MIPSVHHLQRKVKFSYTRCFTEFFYLFRGFLRDYESRLEKEYGYFRPAIQDVVERILTASRSTIQDRIFPPILIFFVSVFSHTRATLEELDGFEPACVI